MFPGSVMMAIATLPFRDRSLSRTLLQLWAVDRSERLLKFGPHFEREIHVDQDRWNVVEDRKLLRGLKILRNVGQGRIFRQVESLDAVRFSGIPLGSDFVEHQ